MIIEYANLIDEIPKKLHRDAIGKIQVGDQHIQGCLLWMDDVALIHHNKDTLQQMLDTTNEITK